MLIAMLYLCAGLLLSTATLGLVAPQLFFRSIRPLATIPGMLMGMCIPPVVVLGILFTALTSAAGELHLPLAQVGLYLHLGCWIVLSYYLLRLRSAVLLLDGAPVPNEQARPVFYGPMVLYRSEARRHVTVQRDIPFHQVEGITLYTDVYRPRPRPGAPAWAPKRPIIFIHGGAWLLGNRRQAPFLCHMLAAQGHPVFAISYRLAPRFPLPAAIHDCKAALAWVRQHAAAYGGSAEAPLVIGNSAGGHLASMLALTAGDARFQPGFESANTEVGGAVILYGVADFELMIQSWPRTGRSRLLEEVIFKASYTDDPERFRLAGPMAHVHKDAPPMLLVHGASDGLVPILHSQRLWAQLKEAGAKRVHLLEVPLAPHAFDIVPTPLQQRAMRVILSFIDSLEPAPSDAAATPPS